MRRLLGLLACFGIIACGGESGVILGPGPDGGGPSSDANNSGAEAGGSDAAAFNVASVPGLALWLRGDEGVTSDANQLVSVWADQSGNKNDAKENRVAGWSGAGSLGLQPKAVASGINGLPTLHFSSVPCTSPCAGIQGNDLLIGDSPTMEWGTVDYLVEVVARYTNDPTSTTGDGFAALYMSIYGPPEMATLGVGLYGNVPAPNNNAKSSAIEAFIAGQPPAVSAGTGYNNGSTHVFGMQRIGTTLSVRLDGAPVGASTVALVDVGKAGGRVGGCENAQAQRLEGDISEVIAVKGTTSASDLAGIEGYLRARYGL